MSSNSKNNNQHNSPSLFMPCARHFMYRQNWHRFRCRLSIMQFLSSRHAYVKSFRTVLLKNPLQPSQLKSYTVEILTTNQHSWSFLFLMNASDWDNITKHTMPMKFFSTTALALVLTDFFLDHSNRNSSLCQALQANQSAKSKGPLPLSRAATQGIRVVGMLAASLTGAKL